MQPNNNIKINEKIKFIRSLKSLTQEQVAYKLGITTHAYAKIERGETDVNFSRLQQIAEVMEIDLLQLLALDETSIFNFSYDYRFQSQSQSQSQFPSQSQQIVCQVNSSMQQSENKHELEKANLIIEQLKKEVEYLNQNNEFIKQQLQEYREIINILKGNHQ
jgi:transcriptional regulator with XRE-family HTH domain